jgi:polysaccharide chain length determinant protein (PEP-CTERM system associated)
MATTNELDYKKHLQLITKNKRLFVTTALAIMTAVTVVSYILPNKYEAKCSVFIEKSLISEIVKGIAITPSIEDKVRGLAYTMRSRTLLGKVINELDLKAKTQNDAQLEGLIKEFQKNTDVKLQDRENLFTISFTNENPRVARDYVNTLVRRYIEENVSSKREESYGATQFLSEQISTIKEKMDKAEAAVNDFKREKNTVIASDPGVIQQEINGIQQKIDDIRIKRVQLESIRMQIRKNNPVQARLVALQKKLDSMRIEYTDSYPEVIRLKDEIESVKVELGNRRAGADMSPVEAQDLEKVESELKALKASEAYQYGIIASNRALLHNIPAAKATLEDLEREKNTQKILYEQLAARHGQSEVSKQMEVQDKATTFRIVDPAVMPIKPVSPNRPKIILIGIFAGILCAFGLLLLLDNLDQSVKNMDLLKGFGVPILAVIPNIQNPVDIMMQKKKDIKLYSIAGVYFCLILTVLLVEVLGVAPFKVLDAVQIKQYLVNLKSQFN